MSGYDAEGMEQRVRDTVEFLLANGRVREAETVTALVEIIGSMNAAVPRDTERMNKLALMALKPPHRVTIVDTGITPYRVCLNGQVLGGSIREVVDKAIV